jgi:arginyl-tRNA synthetase
VGFGLVLGEDGKKFKTRSGDVVRLVELLDEAKSRCKDSVRQRREEVRRARRCGAWRGHGGWCCWV